MAGQAILNGVRRWVRARNGLRAVGVAGIALLGAEVGARLWGVWLPPEVWLAVPATWIVGLGWPVRWERAFLDAGRRWGVGERVAALDVAVRHGSPVFGEALAQEITSGQPQARRIAAGKTEYALGLCVLALAAAVGFVGPLDRSPGLPPSSAASDVTPGVLAADSEGAKEATSVRLDEVLPVYPSDMPGVPGYTPYQDLLASVLGLDDDWVGDLFGEELAARLAAEEGLLRRLAERLAEAAPGGISPSEREQLAPLARELARRDLGRRVEDLLDEGGEGAAREAAEAVGAVLDAAERAGGAGEVDPGAPAAGPATDGEGGVPWEGEGPFADLFDMNGMEGSEPPGEGGVALNVPGATEGDPLAPGPAGDWEVDGVEQEAFGVEGEEGEMRAYLVRGVPGEPAALGDVPSDRTVEQEVEVIVRVRGLPAELRDLVRRYFELIGGVP